MQRPSGGGTVARHLLRRRLKLTAYGQLPDESASLRYAVKQALALKARQNMLPQDRAQSILERTTILTPPTFLRAFSANLFF